MDVEIVSAEDDPYALRDRIDYLETLLATAYQLAGLVGAPERFLDAYSLSLDIDVDTDALLPVGLDELDEFKALSLKLEETLKANGHFSATFCQQLDQISALESKLKRIREVIERPYKPNERTWEGEHNEDTVTMIGTILEEPA